MKANEIKEKIAAMKDFRDWLEVAEALSELQVVKGADWNLEIGAISEINYRTRPNRAQIFDEIKDYPYDPEMGLIRPDIAAPGSNIKSLSYSSNTGYADGWSGTSMATPAHAGMVALMLQKNNTLTPAEISQISEETAHVLQAGKNNNSGAGRIDALAAIEATSLPGPSYYSHVINDVAGNNDGLVNAGESILLTLAVGNFSDEIVNGVTVELSTEIIRSIAAVWAAKLSRFLRGSILSSSKISTPKSSWAACSCLGQSPYCRFTNRAPETLRIGPQFSSPMLLFRPS